MKKILFANTSFLPAIGGVENSIRSLIEAFSSDNWECHLITKDNGKKYQGDFKNIHYYNSNNIFSKFGVVYVLFNLFKQFDFDLVVVRHHVLALLISFFSKKYIYIVPGVYKYQNSNENKYFFKRIKFYLHVKIQELAILRCKNNLVFSSEMYQQVRSFYFGNNLLKVKPGVDSSRFFKRSTKDRNDLRKQYGFNESDTVILCIGRLVDVKNFKLVIESLKYLPKEFSLLIVGHGPQHSLLNDLVNHFNLADRVTFFGKSDLPELLYSASDIFCLPSTYEPFGQVLLEATLSSLPVVAINSSCEGINTATSEIYKDYEGLVFLTENNPVSFALKITESISSPLDPDELQRFKINHSWLTLKDELIKLGIN